jgi:hypothetical protein
VKNLYLVVVSEGFDADSFDLYPGQTYVQKGGGESAIVIILTDEDLDNHLDENEAVFSWRKFE